MCICYALLGVPLFLISIANISGAFADMFRHMYANFFCYACKKYLTNDEGSDKKQVNDLEKIQDVKEDEFSGHTKTKVVDDEDDDDYEEEEKKKANVPLIIVLCLLYGYMIFGGWIFTLIETWTFVNGIYFSFVSLGTLGNLSVLIFSSNIFFSINYSLVSIS